jgi:putative heme iron utilization protein
MNPDLLNTLKSLLASPVAALGTLHEGAPFVSMVPVAAAMEGLLIHVSSLAAHTRDLRSDPRMSLLFMAPLAPDADPLALPRVTLQGEAQEIDRDSLEHGQAATTYLARFPQAEQTLGLGDFRFFLLRPSSGRLVAGFGQALSLGAPEILQALPS